MAVYYSEFDTTAQDLIKDIKTKVLMNPDWSWQGLDTQIAVTNAAAAINAQSVSVANGTMPAALQVGHIIRIGTYASGKYEYRVITAISTTTITFSNGQLTNSYVSGTPIFWGNEVVRTTTVRGAEMILDLTGSTYNGEMARKVAAAAYNGFTPPTTTVAPVITGGSAARSAYFRRGNAALTGIVHVTVSTSKDHIYISVEGPRTSEALPANVTYGSNRGYVFMSDLVPYSPSDTIPCVVIGGNAPYDSDATVANKSHTVSISKSFDGASFWIEGVPLALLFPTTLIAYTVSAQRMTSIDGTDKYYLSPYVIAANDCGLRGRLSSFFYAGSNSTTSGDTFNPTIGSEVIYNGVTYKLTAVSKGDGTGGSTYSWGSLGAVNNSGSDFWQSPIVAIPMA